MLCELIINYDLPLFLSVREDDDRLYYIIKQKNIDAKQIKGFIKEHTMLKILLLTIRNEELLTFKNEFLAHPCIFYNVSGLKNGLSAIEKSIKDFGPDRMVYGSNHPLFCFASTEFLVEKSMLDDDAKKKIMRGNATRLFGI